MRNGEGWSTTDLKKKTCARFFRWKSINELEIKKESLVKSVQRGSASTAGAQNHNIRDCRSGPTGMESPTTIAVDDSTDDDELEVDWRTKTL